VSGPLLRWLTVELAQDLVGVLGPAKRLATLVPTFAEPGDGGDQLLDAGEVAAAERLAFDDCEEYLDQVEPRGIGRGEVQLDAGMGLKPGLDPLVLVSGVVVHHDMQLSARVGLGDQLEEGQELAVAVAGMAGVGHPLLPDQRPPCPRCGSVARRFDQEITNQITLSDSGTGTDTFTVTRTVGLDAVVHAQTATMDITAHDATVQTIEAHGIPSAAQMGNASVVQGPRIIRDHLVVQGRHIWWTQLTEDGGWLLQVVDEAGEEIATVAHYDPIEALAAVAKFILPGHPG
jgi:hypothetical protein